MCVLMSLCMYDTMTLKFHLLTSLIAFSWFAHHNHKCRPCSRSCCCREYKSNKNNIHLPCMLKSCRISSIHIHTYVGVPLIMVDCVPQFEGSFCTMHVIKAGHSGLHGCNGWMMMTTLKKQ